METAQGPVVVAGDAQGQLSILHQDNGQWIMLSQAGGKERNPPVSIVGIFLLPAEPGKP